MDWKGRRAIVGLLSIATAAATLGNGTAVAHAASGYVSAQGTRLTLDGQPFSADGFNDYRVMSVSYSTYTCGGEYADGVVDSELQDMQNAGATVLRTWFYQAYAVDPSTGQIGYWAPFDRVLRLAQKHGLKVIASLADQWGNCENVNWGPTFYKTRAWYQGGYKTATYNGLPLTYYDWVQQIVSRYAGDTRIAFWQLMNEAEALDSSGGACVEGSAAAALRGFADDVAAKVKAIDPNHLVNLGNIGGGQCGIAGADYQYVNGGVPDICEIHDYNGYPEPAYSNPCGAMGKPYFVGERGFNCPGGCGAGDQAARAQTFAQDAAAAFNGQASGYLPWSKSAGGSGGYDIGPGDPAEAALRYWYTMVWGAAAANAAAVELGSLGAGEIAGAHAGNAPPVVQGGATVEAQYGPVSCGPPAPACPGGLNLVSLQAPNQTALATLQKGTPAACNAGLPSLPATALTAAAANACSSVAHLALGGAVPVVADDIQSAAVSQLCGAAGSGAVTIGDLNVAGIQVVGGPGALVPTSSPAPNTTVTLPLVTSEARVDVILNQQGPAPSGGGISVDAVAIRVTVVFGTLYSSSTARIGHADASATCQTPAVGHSASICPLGLGPCAQPVVLPVAARL